MVGVPRHFVAKNSNSEQAVDINQMANPLGTNGTTKRGRPLADALRMELLADDARKMRCLATTVVNLALAGESWAANLVFERIDGKVAQPVGGSDELGPQKLQIEWKLSATNDLADASGPAQLVEQPAVQLDSVQHQPQLPDLTHESSATQLTS